MEGDEIVLYLYGLYHSVPRSITMPLSVIFTQRYLTRSRLVIDERMY